MITINYKKIAKEVAEYAYNKAIGINGDTSFNFEYEDGDIYFTIEGQMAYETSNYDHDTNSADVYFDINTIDFAEVLIDDITYDINNNEFNDALDYAISAYNS